MSQTNKEHHNSAELIRSSEGLRYFARRGSSVSPAQRCIAIQRSANLELLLGGSNVGLLLLGADDLVGVRTLGHTILERDGLELDLGEGVVEDLALLEGVLAVAVGPEMRDEVLLVELYHRQEQHAHHARWLLGSTTTPLDFMRSHKVAHQEAFVLHVRARARAETRPGSSTVSETSKYRARQQRPNLVVHGDDLGIEAQRWQRVSRLIDPLDQIIERVLCSVAPESVSESEGHSRAGTSHTYRVLRVDGD